MTFVSELSGSAPAHGHALANERDDVRAHLLRMCGVRRGSMLVAPDYGVDDPTRLFHSFPGGLDEWTSSLERSIARYEPRLTDVHVHAHVGDSDTLVLQFEISARLVSGGKGEHAHFLGSVDPSEHWKLR